MFCAGRTSPAAAAALYAQPSKVQSAPAAAALYAQPSDVTLVEEFLRPWVTSGEVPTGTGTPVHTVDLYSADPEELARRFQPAVSLDGGGDRTWYFLSPLRNRSPRDRRKVRAVAGGAGCWHSEAGPKNVVDYLDGHRHVGYRQSFSFMRRSDAGTDSRTGWIMAEFHLHQSHEKDGRGRKVEGLVLCKMYRSPRNRGPAVSPDGGDDDDDVGSSISMSADTTFSCGRSKAAGDEDSNADMPRRELCSKNSAAGDDEVSGTTTAAVAVPCPKNKTVVVNDEDFASPPTHKKMRVTVADAESSGAALVLKTTVAGAPNAAGQLHCPQCGFHLATLQPLVTETIEQ